MAGTPGRRLGSLRIDRRWQKKLTWINLKACGSGNLRLGIPSATLDEWDSQEVQRFIIREFEMRIFTVDGDLRALAFL